MPKLKLDKDAVKGFFVLHVEKIVLVVVVLLFVVFVFQGYSRSLDSVSETPDKLADLATTAQDKISTENTWPDVAPELEPKGGHAERVKEGQAPTQDGFYMAEKPWLPVSGQQEEKRADPTLFPPAQVEVYAVAGPVAFRRMSKDDVDLLAELKNSEPKKKEKKVAKKRRKSRRDTYGYGYGEESASMDEYMSEMGSGMMSGYDEESSMSMGMGMGMEMGSGMDMGMGMTGGTRADPTKINGFRAPQAAIARPRNIIAVKALVEARRQWDEFDQAFSTAAGYNPSRDVPRYLLYSAQRADVTADPSKEPAESDWQPISNTNSVRLQLQKEPWAGAAKEIVDMRYASPVLTMPIPPLMMRDLDPLALHSETPRQEAARTAMGRRPGDEETEEGETEDGEETAVGDEPGDIPGMLPGRRGYGGPMGMPGSGMTSGYGMSPGSGMMSGYGMSPESGMMGYGEEEYGSEYMSGEYGEEEYGSEYMSEGYGESGMGYGGYSGMSPGMSMARGPRADYLLVRFYDFSAQPGRIYRYRVQVLLEDPNHPENPRMEPSERTLADEVKTRLASIAEEEKTKNRRVYYLRTDWSDPSDAISIGDAATTLAGKVDIGRTIEVPGVNVELPLDEPKGQIMSVVWDSTYAADAPSIQDVYRGTVLNFSATADVIHPVSLVYKALEDFRFNTQRFVLDFRGGEELPGSTEEAPLRAPGEYVLVDANGDFFVRNELDDWEAFERYKMPEIEAPATGGYPGAGEGMEDYYEGSGYEEMYEQMGGGGGRRGR
jgi:hypothetical protein